MTRPPDPAELRGVEAATWGQRPGNGADRPRMRLISWRPLTKGSLRGFSSIQLPIGLKINDEPVFVGEKGGWAILPGKPILDADGRHEIGANYTAVAEWRTREVADGFSQAVIAAVRQAHPHGLAD
jgi:hypothetical protein